MLPVSTGSGYAPVVYLKTHPSGDLDGDRCTTENRSVRIATFNINNINKRLDNLLAWLAKAEPDVVSLQELKAEQGAFPVNALRSSRVRSGLARGAVMEWRGHPRAKSGSRGDAHELAGKFCEE